MVDETKKIHYLLEQWLHDIGLEKFVFRNKIGKKKKVIWEIGRKQWCAVQSQFTFYYSNGSYKLFEFSSSKKYLIVNQASKSSKSQ